MAEIQANEWDSFLIRHPSAHILQSSYWGQLKTDFGWQVTRVALPDCGAQLMIKQIFPGIRFAYIPKGPVGSDWQHLWPEIDIVCRREKCAFLKVEPNIWEASELKKDNYEGQIPIYFKKSRHSIQPLRTLIIDIQGDEMSILGRMKQKTRYNINLARKKNVVVNPHNDLSAFYDLMQITGQRDQFGIHSLAYYQRAYDLFYAHDACQLLVAEYENMPISALIAFKFGNIAWYFYGASSDTYRETMPNYLLQWEAIRWAKSNGCTKYDLWGVPDADLVTLEANFTRQNDGLWGVYRFKRGFGGELKRSIGPYDRVYNKVLYQLYLLWQNYRNEVG